MVTPFKIKIVMFDLFGTVFDLSGASKFGLKRYAEQLAKFRETGVWAPLILPSAWENLPAYPDAREGIKLLREHFVVVTCTNAPLGLQAMMCKNAGINFDMLTPLELRQTYKTAEEAYLTPLKILNCRPGTLNDSVAMVTANKSFGDLEASAKLGMRPILIRRGEGRFADTVTELAEKLIAEKGGANHV